MRANTLAALLALLRHKQQKQVAMLAKVEKTAARLDRRKARLNALESTIAALEARVAEPHGTNGTNGTNGAHGANSPGTHGIRRAQLIFNPASGRDTGDSGERLARIVESLLAHGIEATVELKTSGRAVRALVRDAVRADAPLVIVAAGDGTIGEVASQLVGSSTVLGLVPIGTMNNVARSLGVPLGIDDACALIGMGTTRHIDIGRVHTRPGERPEYFLECAGVGLATIGALAGQAFEKRRWRVLPRALQRLFQAKLGKVRIELDGTMITASTRLVTVCNAPLLGNNILAAPEAKMDDGFLDISVYDGMGDSALIGHFLNASAHKPDVMKIYRARHVRITSDDATFDSSVPVAEARERVVEIDVLPAALAMIVGNGIGLTVPVASAPGAPAFAPGPLGHDGAARDGAIRDGAGHNGSGHDGWSHNGSDHHGPDHDGSAHPEPAHDGAGSRGRAT
jgi:diacylglycerol kinase (ATP)